MFGLRIFKGITFLFQEREEWKKLSYLEFTVHFYQCSAFNNEIMISP